MYRSSKTKFVNVLEQCIQYIRVGLEFESLSEHIQRFTANQSVSNFKRYLFKRYLFAIYLAFVLKVVNVLISHNL